MAFARDVDFGQAIANIDTWECTRTNQHGRAHNRPSLTSASNGPESMSSRVSSARLERSAGHASVTASPCGSRTSSPGTCQRSPSMVSVCRGNSDLDIDMDFDMMRADAKMSSGRMQREKTSNRLNVDLLSQSRSASPCGSTMASPIGSRNVSPLPDRPGPPEPHSAVSSRAPSQVGSPLKNEDSALKQGPPSSRSSQSSRCDSRICSRSGSFYLDVDMDVDMMRRDTKAPARAKFDCEKPSNVLNIDPLSPSSRAASPSPSGARMFSPLPDRPGPPEPASAFSSRAPSRISSCDHSVIPGIPSERGSWVSSAHSDDIELLSCQEAETTKGRRKSDSSNSNAENYTSGFSVVVSRPASPLVSPCESRANSPIGGERSPSVVSVCRDNTDLDVDMEQDMMKKDSYDSYTRTKILPRGKTASRLIVGSARSARSSTASASGSRAGSRAASPMTFDRPGPPEPPSTMSSRAPSRASMLDDDVASIMPGPPSQRSSPGNSCVSSRAPSVVSICRNNTDLDIDMDFEMMKRDAKDKKPRREKTIRLEVDAIPQSRCSSPCGSTAASPSGPRAVSPMPDRPWNPEPMSSAAPSRASSYALEDEVVTELKQSSGASQERIRSVTIRGFDVDVDLDDDMLESLRPKCERPPKKFSIYTVDADGTDDDRTSRDRIISPVSPLPNRAVKPEPPSPLASTQVWRRSQHRQKDPLSFYSEEPAAVSANELGADERKVTRRITVTDFEDVVANLPNQQPNKQKVRRGRTRTLVSVEVDKRVRVLSSAEELLSPLEPISRSASKMQVVQSQAETPGINSLDTPAGALNSPCQPLPQFQGSKGIDFGDQVTPDQRSRAITGTTEEEFDDMMEFLEKVSVTLLEYQENRAASFIQALYRGKAVRDAWRVFKAARDARNGFKRSTIPSNGENQLKDIASLQDVGKNSVGESAVECPRSSSSEGDVRKDVSVVTRVVSPTSWKRTQPATPDALQHKHYAIQGTMTDEHSGERNTCMQQGSYRSNGCLRQYILASILERSRCRGVSRRDWLQQQARHIHATLGRRSLHQWTPSTVRCDSRGQYSPRFAPRHILSPNLDATLQDVVMNASLRIEALSAALSETRALLKENERYVVSLEHDVASAWQTVDALQAQIDDVARRSVEVEAERLRLQENHRKELKHLEDRYAQMDIRSGLDGTSRSGEQQTLPKSSLMDSSTHFVSARYDQRRMRPFSAAHTRGWSATFRPQSAVTSRPIFELTTRQQFA